MELVELQGSALAPRISGLGTLAFHPAQIQQERGSVPSSNSTAWWVGQPEKWV